MFNSAQKSASLVIRTSFALGFFISSGLAAPVHAQTINTGGLLSELESLLGSLAPGITNGSNGSSGSGTSTSSPTSTASTTPTSTSTASTTPTSTSSTAASLSPLETAAEKGCISWEQFITAACAPYNGASASTVQSIKQQAAQCTGNSTASAPQTIPTTATPPAATAITASPPITSGTIPTGISQNARYACKGEFDCHQQ